MSAAKPSKTALITKNGKGSLKTGARSNGRNGVSLSPLDTRYRKGFPLGFTPVTREGEPSLDAGLDFGIYKLAKGKTIEERHAKETAWLLMDGSAEIAFNGSKTVVTRSSLFDQGPTALHLPPNTPVGITALSGIVEWAVVRAENVKSFEARLFQPENLTPEYRGKGLAQGTCLRNVRLIFDLTNRKESSFVLGEVITFPGRWSTYPPHFHEQPEIYHYRFTLPQGYGHGECGDEVYKVRQFDTLKILNCRGHSQTAAPGYGMYYIWAVRHLKGNPYLGFQYFKEHEWILDAKNQGWQPKDWDSIQ